MILDTSAVVAAIRDETEADRVLEALVRAPNVGIGTPTALESTLVLVHRYGVAGRLTLTRFLERYEVISIPFDERHWNAAAEAHLRYGRGRHPASLNYGDCMAYAAAQVAGAPLLFVGDDFAKTDLVAA